MATKTYQDYYKRYMGTLDTKAYDNLAKNYETSVNQNTQQQISDANKNAQAQLKQAYVTRVQDQRALQNNLASSGIRGGASESSNIRLANQYANTTGQINSQLATSVNDINRTAQQNILAYRQDIDAKKQQAIEDRQNMAMQTAREDATLRRTQDIERYTAWASKYFDTKSLKKQLKKAKKSGNTLKAQIINARLGYLKSPEYKAAKKSAK